MNSNYLSISFSTAFFYIISARALYCIAVSAVLNMVSFALLIFSAYNLSYLSVNFSFRNQAVMNNGKLFHLAGIIVEIINSNVHSVRISNHAHGNMLTVYDENQHFLAQVFLSLGLLVGTQ